MPTIDNWRALREALDPGPTAGVTEGPWLVEVGRSLRVKTASDETICSTGASDSLRNQWERNAEYIAAAHPAAIRSLLDERDRLAAEVESLRADARRYEWITDHCKSEGNGGKHWRILVEGPEPERHDDTDAFNEAIDAAMKSKP